MVWLLVSAAGFPFLIGAILTRLMMGWAPAWGLVDRPGGRKSHARPTPLGGGVAIYGAIVASLASVCLAALLAHHFPSLASALPVELRPHIDGVLSKTPLLAMILGAATLQMLVGLIDDWRPGGIDWRIRLALQLGLSLVLVAASVRLSLFVENKWLTGALTVIWIVGLTNSLNFLDNMDGLAGGVTVLVSAMLVAIAILVGSLFIAGCLAVIAGATLGFLVYNRSPARIFMGDAGSGMLGLLLGALTVIGTYTIEGQSHVTVLAPLCVLAVPLYDTTSVVFLRIAQGKSPFQPDRQHFSHRLVDLGFTRPQAVLVIYLTTLATGLGGLLLYFVTPGASWLIAAQILAMLGVIALIELTAWRRSQAPDKSA